MTAKSLKEQIKAMEQEKRQEVFKPKKDAPVSFDSWFHQRQSSIPKCHLKEILMADFKARGLSDSETMEAFDKALNLYGVKL